MPNYPDLYILRHGQTEWNSQHRIQGSLDSPLTDQGRSEAKKQHALLEGVSLDGYRAFSSPQGRAWSTAQIALSGLFTDITKDSRIAEIMVGDWEGQRRQELDLMGAVDESEESALDLYERAPGGEGFEKLRQRCKSFLDDLQGPAVLVTHGMTSRMLRIILLDMDNVEMGKLPGGQGVIYQIRNGVSFKLG